ncbi:MAG: S8/S53 family peptidase [Nocardiopsaceae bacterium]|nr:S8/S53 family peptidase [Nocardiopsaceae bacterium]
MPEQDSWREGLDTKIAEQVAVIRAAFAEEGIKVNLLTQDGGVRYMYAEGELLVRENYLDRVEAFLDELRDPPVPRDRDQRGRREQEPVIPGIVLLNVADQPGIDDPQVFDELIAKIDERFGEGVATPNHVLTVDGEIGPCPATEPQAAYAEIEPRPTVSPGNAGTGIRIYIADTGLLPEARVHSWLKDHPWLDGVQGELDPMAPGLPTDAANPIKPYAGHGTFVAGVARCVAPGAEVHVDNIFKIAGSALERHFVRKLGRALHQGYDIFHIGASAPTRNDRPMEAFAIWLKQAREYKGVVCVSPAGNSGSHLPSWPAAFRHVVAVGALAGDWRTRALFTNYGPWVDVYAPGRNLINAYANGTYTYTTTPYEGKERTFYGMAQWSGTSFSSPIVTGLIAARMSQTGENGQEAAAALLAEAQTQAIPGVGPRLLPY